MNATATAPAATFRSILEKPLNQLTEDDISELTREACRKFLIEKGMRRPSWNKSQAIQQVISLKALLEPNDDSGTGALRKIVVLPHTTTGTAARASVLEASNSADSAKEASADVQVSVSADVPVTYPRNEQPKRVHEDRPADSDTKDISPSRRNQRTNDASVRQMTIFYCGKVNVYEGVPSDRAQVIMHLAEGSNHLPLDKQFGGTTTARSSQYQFQTLGDKDGLFPSSATNSQAMLTEKIPEYTEQYWEKGNSNRDLDAEGQASRKVSLQRHLEKRKYRGRLKIKKNMGSTSSLEVYLNHQLRTQTSTGNSSRSGTTSPPQPGLPQAVDDQPNVRCLPVDLNEKDILEHQT